MRVVPMEPLRVEFASRMARRLSAAALWDVTTISLREECASHTVQSRSSAAMMDVPII
jgi:hypothetical protein